MDDNDFNDFVASSVRYLLSVFSAEGLRVYRNEAGEFEITPLKSLAELQHYAGVLEVVEANAPLGAAVWEIASNDDDADAEEVGAFESLSEAFDHFTAEKKGDQSE